MDLAQAQAVALAVWVVGGVVGYWAARPRRPALPPPSIEIRCWGIGRETATLSLGDGLVVRDPKTGEAWKILVTRIGADEMPEEAVSEPMLPPGTALMRGVLLN